MITAAHCNSGLFGSLQVILGEHNLKTEEMVAIDSSFVETEPVIRRVKRIIVHPKYQPRTLENDLALIELDGSVQFERHIQPICLPERGDQFIDAEAYVSGWGLLSYGMFDISVIVLQKYCFLINCYYNDRGQNIARSFANSKSADYVE